MGAGQTTTGPSAGVPFPASAAASVLPTLDPSRSDAGIYGRIILSDDPRADRDGVYDIYAVDDDGSECSGAFEAPNYTVVAYVDDAPDGQLRRLGITVAAEDIPDTNTTFEDITGGGVSFDFASETGFGTTYSGNSTRQNEGSSTISVVRDRASLRFEFEGKTYDGARFTGEFLCAEI